MFNNWFTSQQVGSRCDNGTPIAPLSVQGVAEKWEPSVQNMVCERGGFKISALEEAVSNRWGLKFKISKVSLPYVMKQATLEIVYNCFLIHQNGKLFHMFCLSFDIDRWIRRDFTH